MFGFLAMARLSNGARAPHAYGLLCAVAAATASWAASCAALPPLGLTELGELPANLPLADRLAVVGDRAYVSRFNDARYWTVGSDAMVDLIDVVHPILGTPARLSEPVQATDGRLYFTANFTELLNGSPRPRGAAFYRLDDPAHPVTTWTGRVWAGGVDRNLRSYGYVYESFLRANAAFLAVDGNISFLPTAPQRPFSGAGYVTPNGYVLGSSQFEGTEEFQSGIWDPMLNFQHLGGATASSMRDSLEGNGVNIGLEGGGVDYADGNQVLMRINDDNFSFVEKVLVSQTAFTIGVDHRSRAYAYFPGIIPGRPDAALEFSKVFPELSDFAISDINGLFAIDGRVYMTLVSGRKAYLFGALDPSLRPVPEPACAALFSLLATCFVRRRTRRR